MDPKGMVDGPNMYQYCGGDPVNKWDPMGTEWAIVAEDGAFIYDDDGKSFIFGQGDYDDATIAASKAKAEAQAASMRKVKGQEGAKVIWVESAKGRWQGGMEAPGQGAARLTSGRWTTRAALEQQRAHALKLAEQFNAASQKAVDASNKPQFRNLSDLSPQEWSDIGNMVENFEIVGDFVAVYRRPGDVTSYIGFR